MSVINICTKNMEMANVKMACSQIRFSTKITTKRTVGLYLFVFLLSACDGGSPNLVNQNPVINENPGEVESANGGGTASQINLPPIYANPLLVQSADYATLPQTAVDTLAEFNDFNSRSVATAPTGASKYDGSILGQIGSSNRYLEGGVGITFDMIQGSGRGSVGFISMSGPNTQNGLLDLTTSLVVSINALSRSSVSGKITGEISDSFAFDRQYSEEFLVDVNFTGQFVDIGGGRTGLVAVFDGTINSETDGVNTFKGVISNKHSLF